uniref:Lysine exporter protein (LYSE/YGGA) n=1 Tax=Shewanella putrefaciens (strain 200) TaxID=399804 RepID=E6XIS5_SHEP2
MDLSLLLTLALIHAVALVSPGPDFAIMVKIATQQSRSAAVAAAVGISVAIVAHTILSLTGVSLVIKSSHTLYLLVQIIGACYLAWMGWGALRAAFTVLATPKGSQGVNDSGMAGSAVTPVPLGTTMSPKQGFLTGLYTNLLNPKALVFFLTLFSALITPSVTVSTKVAAAMLLLLLSLLWFGFLALMLSKVQVQRKLQRLTPVIDTVIGVIFIAVAFAIVSNLLFSA